MKATGQSSAHDSSGREGGKLPDNDDNAVATAVDDDDGNAVAAAADDDDDNAVAGDDDFIAVGEDVAAAAASTRER